MKTIKKNFIISAAGGNNTHIQVLPREMSKEWYSTQGSRNIEATTSLGVEQAGFLIPSLHRFEMSGGEFCGNAARVATLLFCKIFNKPEVSFTMSGFEGVVNGRVDDFDAQMPMVECYFAGMKVLPVEVQTSFGSAKMVDLGGIVHVIIEGKFPVQKSDYESIHRKITSELGLSGRSAVGVDWIASNEKGVEMHPVVWVKSIDTFFYESACGSGSIATSAVSGFSSVVQPTGQTIEVVIASDGVTLRSNVSIVCAYDDITYMQVKKDDPVLFAGFANVYKSAFAEAPYFESYEDSWVYENVWLPHLQTPNAAIFLAMEGDTVVALACCLPTLAEKKVASFLQDFQQGEFFVDTSMYMSELATLAPYRKIGIASELVKQRIDWAKSRGFKTVVMRTASEGSNSANLYLRLGGKVLSGAIQNVAENLDEVASSSEKRLYIYIVL